MEEMNQKKIGIFDNKGIFKEQWLLKSGVEASCLVS